MEKESRDALEADRRFRTVKYVLSTGKIAAECRDFGVPRSTFYQWKAAYEKRERKRNYFVGSPLPRVTRGKYLPNMWRRSFI